MFSNELSNAYDTLTDAFGIYDDILDRIVSAIEDAEETFEILDELTTTVYGLDPDLFLGSITHTQCHEAVRSARKIAEVRRDELYDMEDSLESLSNLIDDAIDKADLL